LEGVDAICKIKEATGATIIGLIKKEYSGFEPYITPTRAEIKQLQATGCEIIALDGTDRARPDGSTLAELITVIHEDGQQVMADCDSLESALFSARSGADFIGTTLAGYTAARGLTDNPDIELVRDIALALPKMQVIAEGRYSEKWQVEAALRAGASAVTIGGALNDPAKNTRRLLPPEPSAEVVAIDIGGTWIRSASMSARAFERGFELTEVDRAPLMPTRNERVAWMVGKVAGLDRVGISSAGVIWNNRVTLSKKFIPENQGTDYNVLRSHLSGKDKHGLVALGDGHACAWAHACHPDFAGKDIAVLAIGTGLGFGHVREGKIVRGQGGLYSRLNDLPTPNGKTFEQLLGGFALTSTPTEEQKREANEAIHHAIRMVSTFLFPDIVIVCGTVGMQPWLDLELPHLEGWPDVPVVRSPFGANAGLFGAAAIALFPPFEPER
jgi:putative N-acetylmannosamine-6-phosphate epimerase/predicted NBD/HSP70 family sugar kinase